ncbi:MAG: hypothetical protein IJV04_00605 [Lachnospiraceae bacterium]|nr:hypothetical protein [Lachnospiraceae bacterium]
MNEFKKNLIAELKRLSGQGGIIESRQVVKTNDVMYDAITIQGEADIVSKMIYLDSMYKEYEQGRPLQDIAAGILAKLRCTDANMEYTILDRVKDIYDMEAVKDKVVIRLLNHQWNRRYLDGKAHMAFLDLAIAFCITEDFEDGHQSMLLPQEAVSQWGVSNEELLEIAKSNTEH